MVRAAVAVLLVAFLAACAAPARPAVPDAAFVGGSADGALSVALAVHAGRATGFTTDDAGAASWFDGTATGGLLDLRAADGAGLRGGVHGRIVHGGVVVAEIAGTPSPAPDRPRASSSTASVSDRSSGWSVAP